MVASGLLNPRGLTVAADGTVYVAEAGTGGTEPDFATAPIVSPGASGAASQAPSGSPAPVATHGETGRVTKITADGQQSVLVDGLTSYNFGPEAVGPADVALGQDGTVYVSIGGPGPGTAQFVPSGNADSVVSVDSSGTVTPLANIAQYERTNNPDPNAIDSNVGGIAVGANGLLYVADSGGNDLYSVDPASGELKVAAVFPGLPSIGNAPNPARGNKPEVDPVPTDVQADPSGGVYVGFLGGAALWGQPGAAKVVHVGVDGMISDAVTGLTMVTGVTINNGSIYASELSTNFTVTPPAPGEVAQAAPGAAAQVLFSSVPLPYGLGVAPDGQSIYVVINATGAPGATPDGEVLKCALPQQPQASPAASPKSSASPAGSPAIESASPVTSATPKPRVTTTPAASSPAVSLPASAPPAS
jgi:hypothetical protein